MLDTPKGRDPWDGGDGFHDGGWIPRHGPDYLPKTAMLDGHTVVPCRNTLEWARWFETANRHVGDTIIKSGVRVSTVFLGLDHSHAPGARPLWFETMTFRTSDDSADM